jgi:AAA15 family ATPase/GTPase
MYLTHFHIKNFKKLEDVELPNIGHFNLIVGDNNVGKTTLLEALLWQENFDVSILSMLSCYNWRGLGDVSEEDFKKMTVSQKIGIKSPIHISWGANEEHRNFNAYLKQRGELTNDESKSLKKNQIYPKNVLCVYEEKAK